MIKRIIPPAAAPVEWKAFIYAIKGFFSEDKAIARLEEEIKEFFGVRYTFLLSSGKSALYLILKSLKRLSGERSNVIIPAYTCFSVPSAIKKAGLNVILCDIEKNFDFNYNHLNRLPVSYTHL
ncbi:MAG: DegT/DnrJ/EryC1/StrS family aminotransferase, partial [Thermodesulfovibrionales bacterium]|nr:DegT/DnrJ/EryC1/StrS family aminotransferase [Thermodesulfovibrionales bacterium]